MEKWSHVLNIFLIPVTARDNCVKFSNVTLGSDIVPFFKKLSSAPLGSLSFSKSSYLENSANTSFLKNFEKDHWQSTVLMGKFQFFLSTMAPEGHFQPKD